MRIRIALLVTLLVLGGIASSLYFVYRPTREAVTRPTEVSINEPTKEGVAEDSGQDETKPPEESEVAGATSNTSPSSPNTTNNNPVHQEPTEPSGGVEQAPEPEQKSEPNPIEAPESKPEPTPTPEPEAKTEQPPVSCCTNDTIATLNDIASKIGGINNEINSLEASNKKYSLEKSACRDKYVEIFNPESRESLIEQCQNNSQSMIDANNKFINDLREKRGGWYQARDTILASCPDCNSAWDKLVQAYRDKGWPL